MGKVYEALTRAESESNKTGGSLDDEQEFSTNDTLDEFGYIDEDGLPETDFSTEIENDSEQNGFNFLRYSLSASSLFGRGRDSRGAAALMRRSQVQPAREV